MHKNIWFGGCTYLAPKHPYKLAGGWPWRNALRLRNRPCREGANQYFLKPILFITKVFLVSLICYPSVIQFTFEHLLQKSLRTARFGDHFIVIPPPLGTQPLGVGCLFPYLFVPPFLSRHFRFNPIHGPESSSSLDQQGPVRDLAFLKHFWSPQLIGHFEA